MTSIVLRHTAGSKRITKENIYSGKGWLKKLMEMESPSDGLVISETKDAYQSS